MLQFFHKIATHVEDDEAQLQHKVFQTAIDLEGLEGRKGTLELIKAGIFIEEDGDEACQSMDAIGTVLNHLTAHIAHQQHKLEVLKLALRTARAANMELSGFANALPGIPNLD